ncbi:Amino Acid/Auxin Permease (AAAP) Family [Achlya hypogyna]|uniref:Amino Acid/Auxin Permease (AAAP) Family n=1 Tax=Achlya hypogyna TaxID=1202772 RepID=A0A1V9YC15_ACHHY|nr:Amino Acid/Auxin Permease (AAAP) Family [Achlya hypogyna]
MALLTVEDAKAAFNLFCCVYGIGTLGMPGNFARAGPLCGAVALAFMGVANVYASVVVSKVMLRAPASVQTFADVGGWALGRHGRVAVILSQMGVCLFVPCAFLVLGGSLLDTVIPDAFSPRNWTIIMAITILPVTLVPTLKEGAGAALAGCLGTIVADFLALGVLVYYLEDSAGAIPSPSITFDSIASTFGNLSLAYGAAIVIPDLQRQHSDPTRMPRVVFATLLLISVLFIAIAVTGYAMVGCQIPGNLLFAVSGNALGFSAPRGPVVLAFLAMQLHITIGFSVLLHPAFYYAERAALGLHRPRPRLLSEATTTDDDEASGARDYPQDTALVASTDDDEKAGVTPLADDEDEGGRFAACCALRTAMVAGLTLASVVLHDHFHDLVDLVGASSVSLSCIILPILSYLCVFAQEVPWYERAYCYLVMGVCGVLSVYVTAKSARAMVAPVDAAVVFPFCPANYQHFAYTNVTHYGS